MKFKPFYELKFVGYTLDGIEIEARTRCPYCGNFHSISLLASKYNEMVRFCDIVIECSCGECFNPPIFPQTAGDFLNQYRKKVNKHLEEQKLKVLETIGYGIDPEVMECFLDQQKKGIRKGGNRKNKKRKKSRPLTPTYFDVRFESR